MKLELRELHGAVHVDLTAETPEEREQVRALLEALNGGALDKEDVASNAVFDLPVRIESVGFDDDGNIESFALEAELPS